MSADANATPEVPHTDDDLTAAAALMPQVADRDVDARPFEDRDRVPSELDVQITPEPGAAAGGR